MKLRSLLAGTGMMCLVISCEKNNEYDESLYSVGLNECQTLQAGGDQFAICTDILNDSRCPEDVVCATAGMAYARFNVTVNNTAHSFYMRPKASPTHPGQYPTDTTISGFKIEFLDIEPHLRTNIPPAVQKARLRITKP